MERERQSIPALIITNLSFARIISPDIAAGLLPPGRMSGSDLFQANLSLLKQTQANQANDNVNDNDNANENDSVSVSVIANANAMTAQCAIGDPLDPCAADAAPHTHNTHTFSAHKKIGIRRGQMPNLYSAAYRS